MLKVMNSLVIIVISPLMSIVEDQVKYSGSLGIQAYLGKATRKIEKY